LAIIALDVSAEVSCNSNHLSDQELVGILGANLAIMMSERTLLAIPRSKHGTLTTCLAIETELRVCRDDVAPF
jgi:hypothetical protein